MRTWGLWGVLALGLALSAWGMAVRGPLTATAPAAAFSAGRAMADVRRIAGEAHIVGSPAEARVRSVLLGRLAALGLDPSLRPGFGIDVLKRAPGAAVVGPTQDVLGLLPGRDPSLPALLLMAHYDTVENSPGAADDSAGVASALEIMRLLKASGPHARDVMVLLTDGEEAGLLGADAFFNDPDPLARHVGAVINLETRGDAGRASMFEAGRDDGGMIRLYARTARGPFANSLTSFLYHLLPNDTDFSRARPHGLPGLNFAFIGDQLAYHTPLATPDHLSQESLQNMGDQAAPVARALADAAALPAPSPDIAYCDVFGLGVVHYPAGLGWIVVLAAAGFIVLAWIGARGAGPEAPRPAGVASGAVAAVGAALAAWLADHVAGVMLDSAGYAAGYHLYRSFDLLFAGAALLAAGAAFAAYAAAGRPRVAAGLAAAGFATAALTLAHGLDLAAWAVAAVAAGAFAWNARRPLRLWDAGFGALTPGLVAAVALQATAPLAAPLLAWPLLLASTGLAASAWIASRRPTVGWIVCGSMATVSLAVLGGLANALFTALGPSLLEILSLFVLLALFSLAPFAAAAGEGRAAAWLATGLVALGGAAVLAVGFGGGTARAPALVQAFYVAGPDGGQIRVSPSRRLQGWERATLSADGAAPRLAALPPLAPTPVWTAAAAARPLTPPTVRLERVGDRVRLTAQATGGGWELHVFLRSPAGVTGLTSGGRMIATSAPAGAWASISYVAPPPGGAVIAFRAPGPVEAVVYEQREGWPQGASPAQKPVGTMAWRYSDSTFVAARATLP